MSQSAWHGRQKNLLLPSLFLFNHSGGNAMTEALNRFIGILLVAFIVSAPARDAFADPPQHFVVFGDSLSDPGNAFVVLKKVGEPAFEVPPFSSLIPDAPYARGALHFSNGPTWIEQLSLVDHSFPTAGPALLVPTVFSNYAVGGARARRSGDLDLSTQVNLFLQDFHGSGPADSLYVIWIGSNDVRDALEALRGDPSGATSGFIVQQAISSISNNLLALYNGGARRFLIANAPDIGLAPAVQLQGLGAQGAARSLSLLFNGALEQLLSGLSSMPYVQFVRLDVFTILTHVVASPASEGLRNVQDPCIRLNTFVHAYCSRPDQFLFWDGIHPTVAGHRILAKHANAALNHSSTFATAH
jgi:phospholipase/lecithinase/hemolysin